jgi:hypothetical protein
MVAVFFPADPLDNTPTRTPPSLAAIAARSPAAPLPIIKTSYDWFFIFTSKKRGEKPNLDWSVLQGVNRGDRQLAMRRRLNHRPQAWGIAQGKGQSVRKSSPILKFQSPFLILLLSAKDPGAIVPSSRVSQPVNGFNPRNKSTREGGVRRIR